MTEEKTDLTQVYLGEPMRLAGVTQRSVGNLSSKKSRLWQLLTASIPWRREAGPREPSLHPVRECQSPDSLMQVTPAAQISLQQGPCYGWRTEFHNRSSYTEGAVWTPSQGDMHSSGEGEISRWAAPGTMEDRPSSHSRQGEYRQHGKNSEQRTEG